MTTHFEIDIPEGWSIRAVGLWRRGESGDRIPVTAWMNEHPVGIWTVQLPDGCQVEGCLENRTFGLDMPQGYEVEELALSGTPNRDRQPHYLVLRAEVNPTDAGDWHAWVCEDRMPRSALGETATSALDAAISLLRAAQEEGMVY